MHGREAVLCYGTGCERATCPTAVRPHVVWESGGSLGRYGVAAYRSRVMRNVPFHSLSNVMWLKSNQALRRSLDGHHLAEVKQLVCLQSCFQICFLFLFV